MNLLLPEQISPEVFEIAQVYLKNHQNTEATARELNLPVESIVYHITKPEAQMYINQIFHESGFLAKEKFFGIMDTIIETKLKELDETGTGSSEDILTIMEKAHKMKMAEYKMLIELKRSEINTPSQQTNIQANIFPGSQDSKYTDLLANLVKGR